jgi:acyl carrier protein
LSLSDRLLDVFATALSVDSQLLSEQSSPENTASWDSVSNMMLVAGIEDEFGIELTTNEITEMTSLGEARKILRNRSIKGV